jgi:hypothetical protein
MRAAIVVRHLGKAVDHRGDLVEAVLRHRHCGEREAAAETLGVVHRPEAAERAVVEQSPKARDHVRLVQAEARSDLGVGPITERKAALERVNQPTITVVHHATARRSGA